MRRTLKVGMLCYVGYPNSASLVWKIVGFDNTTQNAHLECALESDFTPAKKPRHKSVQQSFLIDFCYDMDRNRRIAAKHIRYLKMQTTELNDFTCLDEIKNELSI